MTTTVSLLNDDGSASVATALLMSHHAFRRDIARFGRALAGFAGDQTRAAALREEWQSFRGSLHGHHQIEDTKMFPGFRGANAELAPVFDQLSAQHDRIDPLLERADAAFAALETRGSEAASLVKELAGLLDEHLALEETHVPAFLRPAKEFPPTTSDAESDAYAQGFAWSSEGVAPEVLNRVYGILPAAVVSRLPAAREAFAARCARVWGETPSGASRTSVPDWLTR